MIRLLSLEMGESSTAFQHPRYTPWRMCEGEEGQIFVECRDKESLNFVTLLLDCSTANFSIIRSIPHNRSILDCYIPRHRLLVTCGYNDLKAVSSEDGKTEWEMKLSDDLARTEYSQELEAVLVSTWRDHQVHVVNASDGVLRQTLELGEDVGTVFDMRLLGNQLIVLYQSQRKTKVGLFSLQ